MLEVARHPALARFDVLQELSPEDGRRVLLGRSKAGKLVSIELLFEGTVPADVSTALSRQSSLSAKLGAETVVQTRALLLEPDLAAIVTEFVSGVSLQRLLRFASSRGVRLPDEAGWYIVERVLDALAYAHADAVAPIVHGGVSPGAVVIGWDGAVKLGDFGIEKVHATLARARQAPGAIAPIMAPEQARGGAVTERADVFCAALLALRIATGRTPYARFRENAAEKLLAMSEGAIAKFGRVRPDLPEAVRDAFDRALEPNPEARAVTARDLANVVRASFDVDAGRAAVATLLARWRAELETSVSPWHRAEPGIGPPRDAPHDRALALSSADDRPSDRALVADTLPSDPDALATAVLPPMRMPSAPVHGGAANVPRPIPRPFFSGGVAAVFVAAVFAVMIAAAVLLFKWLLGPMPPP